MVWSPSDEALLAGLASGDREAAASFVRRFQSRVHGLAYTLVGDAAVAEEIAQEALLRAWRHAGAYDRRRGRRDVAPVDRLAFAIDPHLRHGASRSTRTRWRKEALFMRPRNPGGGAPGGRGAAMPCGNSRRTAPGLVVVRCGASPAHEISEMEGAPLGTTKSRIRSAMLKLRGELEVTDER